MASLVILFFILLYATTEFLSVAWPFIVVTLITGLHTVEEAKGGIWEELPLNPPAWLYFVFQGFVLTLGWLATCSTPIVWPFVIVRWADVLITHLLLGAPGKWTAPLLIADAILVAMLVR